MAGPTHFKARAKAMAIAMSEAQRWVYALPPVVEQNSEAKRTFDLAIALLDEAGVPRVAQAANARVLRFASDEQSTAFVLFDQPELEVVLLEADGENVITTMRTILERTGFIPQSVLWQAAVAVEDTERARRAVKTLAHMVVAWDPEWLDLFLLHLAAPDAVVRHDAVLSTTLAAMVARDVAPALELLDEAHSRETFPKLANTIDEARRLLRASAGEAIDIAQMAGSDTTPN